MTTPYATLVAHVHVGGPSGPSTGARLWWLVVATYVAVVAAAVLVGPAVTGGSGRRGRRRVAAGALVLAATAAAASNGAGLGTLALTAAHLSAAAVWLGGLLRLAVRRVQPLRAAVRAFTPWAVTSAGAVAATGVVLAVRDGVGLKALTSTSFGLVLLVKASLLLAAAASGLGQHLRGTGRRLQLLRAESGMLATTLAFGAALVALPLGSPTVQLLGPGLAAVRFGAAGTATVFTVSAGGRDTILLLSDEVLAVQEPGAAALAQLAPGRPLGLTQDGDRVRLRLLSGSTVVDVTLPAQRVAALPVGGMAALVAQVLAVGRPASARAACRPGAAALGHAVGLLLRARRLDWLTVIEDGSPHSRPFAAGVRSAGVATPGRGAKTLLLAGGIEQARHVLATLAETSAYRAIVLAPWLLDRDVLATVAANHLPPVLVAARSDAMAPVADRYRAALSALGNGLAPSAAGLDAYAGAAGLDGDRRLTLYTATPVGFLPGVLAVGHTHRSSSWLPGGSLVAVSRPVPVACTTSATTGAA